MKSGSCRIIGGKWRGRKISFDDAEGLRPTTDRIRETVFNWLQPYVFQSHCLDMFAGSGALGFEALSRGAESVVFIEQNRKTVSSLKANAQLLATDDVSIIQQDASSWLADVSSGMSPVRDFDLVFLDPPFHSELLQNSSQLLESSGCLSEDAIIYVEHAAEQAFAAPGEWVCLKDKKAGQVRYQLYERQI